VSLFRRGGKADWLVVGLGNPGDRYARTRHNVGFEVAKLLADRLGLPRFKQKYGGLYTEGKRVAVLLPQTYMNESGNSVSPARGALGVDLDHVLVVEKIAGRNVTFIYSWGIAPAWNITRPGFERVTGIVDDADVLRGTLSNGAEVDYRLSQDQQALAGEYVLRGRTTLGSFKRQ